MRKILLTLTLALLCLAPAKTSADDLFPFNVDYHIIRTNPLSFAVVYPNFFWEMRRGNFGYGGGGGIVFQTKPIEWEWPETGKETIHDGYSWGYRLGARYYFNIPKLQEKFPLMSEEGRFQIFAGLYLSEYFTLLNYTRPPDPAYQRLFPRKGYYLLEKYIYIMEAGLRYEFRDKFTFDIFLSPTYGTLITSQSSFTEQEVKEIIPSYLFKNGMGLTGGIGVGYVFIDER